MPILWHPSWEAPPDIWEWLHDSCFKLPKTDYVLILVILVVIASLGFMEGISTGLVIAVVLFVVNSGRVHHLSNENFGTMEKNEPELAFILYKHMTQILSERLRKTNNIIQDLI